MTVKRKSRTLTKFYVYVMFPECIFPHNLRDDKRFYGRDDELNEMRRQLLGEDIRFLSVSPAVTFRLLVLRSIVSCVTNYKYNMTMFLFRLFVATEALASLHLLLVLLSRSRTCTVTV